MKDMNEGQYDLVAEKKKEFNKPSEAAYLNARKASDMGNLKLVKEFIMEPYIGHGFELEKGQVVHYELIDGPQILDTVYLVKSRPSEEWADTYPTSQYGALTYREGMHFYSNHPYMRPLLTLIKDTVDYENLKAKYGDLAEHNFVYPGGRCQVAMHEQAYGEPNLYNCDWGLLEGIAKVAGVEVARQTKIPNTFMHFQPLAYDKQPTNYSLFSAKDVFKRGDHVQLLVHDDLYVSVSLCPLGDQHDMSSKETLTTFPVKVKIFEGADGPLETAPDPQFKSMTQGEFIKNGFKSTPSGRVGDKNSETAFK
ncbi:hypothetical protein D1AOALGA4SA_7010 [Olavius algarvensis Delta 1 endosymbiont]|nr:hypothetical protein D1AOALGA4SA_7010 [Olavius algarvensis Delta 1 endosymbiont]